jgi:hypothetical protein
MPDVAGRAVYPGEVARRAMSEPPVEGITISNEGERVVIEAREGRWEGSAAEAERLLTRLHYILARARPGTNIGSVFLNGRLWGGKVVEKDPAEAIRKMRAVVEQLAQYVASLEDEADDSASDG